MLCTGLEIEALHCEMLNDKAPLFIYWSYYHYYCCPGLCFIHNADQIWRNPPLQQVTPCLQKCLYIIKPNELVMSNGQPKIPLKTLIDYGPWSMRLSSKWPTMCLPNQSLKNIRACCPFLSSGGFNVSHSACERAAHPASMDMSLFCLPGPSWPPNCPALLCLQEPCTPREPARNTTHVLDNNLVGM